MPDLSAQEPERVKKMTAALAEWRASVEKSLAGGDYDGGLKSDGTPTAPSLKQDQKRKKKRVGDAK